MTPQLRSVLRFLPYYGEWSHAGKHKNAWALWNFSDPPAPVVDGAPLMKELFSSMSDIPCIGILPFDTRNQFQSLAAKRLIAPAPPHVFLTGYMIMEMLFAELSVGEQQFLRKASQQFRESIAREEGADAAHEACVKMTAVIEREITDSQTIIWFRRLYGTESPFWVYNSAPGACSTVPSALVTAVIFGEISGVVRRIRGGDRANWLWLALIVRRMVALGGVLLGVIQLELLPPEQLANIPSGAPHIPLITEDELLPELLQGLLRPLSQQSAWEVENRRKMHASMQEAAPWRREMERRIRSASCLAEEDLEATDADESINAEEGGAKAEAAPSFEELLTSVEAAVKDAKEAESAAGVSESAKRMILVLSRRAIKQLKELNGEIDAKMAECGVGKVGGSFVNKLRSVVCTLDMLLSVLVCDETNESPSSQGEGREARSNSGDAQEEDGGSRKRKRLQEDEGEGDEGSMTLFLQAMVALGIKKKLLRTCMPSIIRGGEVSKPRGIYQARRAFLDFVPRLRYTSNPPMHVCAACV